MGILIIHDFMSHVDLDWAMATTFQILSLHGSSVVLLFHAV
jgi:hypothetical protein